MITDAEFFGNCSQQKAPCENLPSPLGPFWRACFCEESFNYIASCELTIKGWGRGGPLDPYIRRGLVSQKFSSWPFQPHFATKIRARAPLLDPPLSIPCERSHSLMKRKSPKKLSILRSLHSVSDPLLLVFQIYYIFTT